MCACELRAHHALCILFFRGMGYSPEFVARMTALVGTLHASDPLLTLCRRADDLCRSCPHDRNGVCESAEKVARYDDAVLRLTRLGEGETLRASRLAALVRERILAPGRLSEVCGDCRWHGFCAGLAAGEVRMGNAEE